MENKTTWLLNYALQLNSAFTATTTGSKDDFSDDRVKIFFHKERLSYFLRGFDDKIIPITFEIWPSLSCDARCPLCTYSLNNARTEADKSNELFVANAESYKSVLDKFKKAGVNSIIVTGGGEPLISPDLLEIIGHVNFLNLKWGMFTHGMLLNEKNIHGLLANSPRFIRLSINAGSALSHYREYRIGMHTYEEIKSRAILASRISHQYSRCIGLGYALNGKTSLEDILGMQHFITEIMEASQGGLASVSFRPKVLYYNSNKLPAIKQPQVELLPELCERIEQHLVYPLKQRFGQDLKIDFKKAMFRRLFEEMQPANSISTGWTGSIDEQGRGYIISELNGSTWDDAQFGNFKDSSFADVWSGSRRKEIIAKYTQGQILAPVHHKLSHIDATLKEIRQNIGVLDKYEVDAFWSALDQHALTRPKNWDFL